MNFVGHQKIIKYLDKSREKNNLSQTYLFSGPKNLGKFTLALDFAKKITGGKGQKINPDIIVISSEIEEKKGIVKEQDIKIEKIRELEHKLSLSAYYGKHKVAIIDNAEKLTVSAQNALLKILEEPSKNCVLILICHDEEKLLPTIKSRCLSKKFTLVKEDELRKIIKEKKLEEEILFWSFNRPGLVINFQKDKKALEKRREAKKNLEKILRATLNDKFSLADNLSKNKPELIEKLNLWITILRKKILGENQSLKIDSKKALELIEEIIKNLKILETTNASPKAVLENLFLKI